MKYIYSLTPVFNDWESFNVLINHVEKLQKIYLNKYVFVIIAVNDGSTDLQISKAIKSNITTLNLKVNIGYQRAIAVGLQYIYNELERKDFIVVMDSDGEDRPEDIITLIEKAPKQDNKKIIFAQRQKRLESFLFKIGHIIYKKLFHFLAGQKIYFGNFSVILDALLLKVVHQNNIWNHFSGGIIQSEIPFDKVL
jgi:glycosyltransferase involved in cell wall biosynthesis